MSKPIHSEFVGICKKAFEILQTAQHTDDSDLLNNQRKHLCEALLKELNTMPISEMAMCLSAIDISRKNEVSITLTFTEQGGVKETEFS